MFKVYKTLIPAKW